MRKVRRRRSGNGAPPEGLIGENILKRHKHIFYRPPTGGSRSYVGGSIGGDVSGGNGGSVSNDYWDLDSSGITDPSQGAGIFANDPGITGSSDAQLKSGLPAGFGSGGLGTGPDLNNGLPYLINNPPQK